MLTIQQLEANKTKFKETKQKYNIMTKELEEFLGNDLCPQLGSLNMVGDIVWRVITTYYQAHVNIPLESMKYYPKT